MTDTDPETPSFMVQKIVYLSARYVKVSANAYHGATGHWGTVEYVVPIDRAPRAGDRVFLVTP